MRDHQSSSPAVIASHVSFFAGSHCRAYRSIVWLPAIVGFCALVLPTARALARGLPAPPYPCLLQKAVPTQATELLPRPELAPHGDDMGANITIQEKIPAAVDQDAAKADTPAERRVNDSLASRFGLAFRASTLGLGADTAFRIARPVNVRVGFNTFQYTRSLSKDGTPYQGSLHLRSVETVVDWFPFRHSFHVSSGVLFFNGNRVTAVATPPVGQVLTAGELAYVSDPQDPITGSAKSATKRIAPVAMVGFGNLVPRNRHFGYSIDLGVVFQGVPKSTFTLAGGACDPTGEFCARAAEDSSIQAEAQSARTDLAHHVSFMKYYPVVSMEFGYRF